MDSFLDHVQSAHQASEKSVHKRDQNMRRLSVAKSELMLVKFESRALSLVFLISRSNILWQSSGRSPGVFWRPPNSRSTCLLFDKSTHQTPAASPFSTVVSVSDFQDGNAAAVSSPRGFRLRSYSLSFVRCVFRLMEVQRRLKQASAPHARTPGTWCT